MFINMQYTENADDNSYFWIYQVGLPTAELDCDLPQYVDLICCEYSNLFNY